jgi:effector-binding domain-containing protein
MSEHEPGELLIPVQVRDLPGMRVAQVQYVGPPAAIGAAFERANQFVLERGIGPCGPLIGVYARIGEAGDPVDALVQVPVTRVHDVEPEDGIELLRLPRQRAACLMFNGLMGPEFRQVHFDLFAWMDAQALPRAGTAHEHAYIAGTGPQSAWTVEIRVPILGGRAPRLAI